MPPQSADDLSRNKSQFTTGISLFVYSGKIELRSIAQIADIGASYAVVLALRPHPLTKMLSFDKLYVSANMDTA
jgi:hypothetical protein